MSAFIVQDHTINRVVSHLAMDREGDWLRRKILTETGCDLDTDAGRAALGAAMFALNCNAVDQRYGPGEAKEFRALDYGYRYENSSLMQAYKSLRCWLYQCAEGDVPDNSLLYSTMSHVAGEMAELIVSRMDAYEKARWD